MSWLDKWATKKPATARPLPTGVSQALAGDPQARRYAEGALRRASEAIASAPEGTRNDTLNAESWSIGQLVKAGHLGEDEALGELWAAGRACGLSDDEIGRTVPRAMGDAEARQVVLDGGFGDPPPVGVFRPPRAQNDTIPHHVTEDDSGGQEGGENGNDRTLYIRKQVEAEKLRLHISDTARREFEQERSGDTIDNIPEPTSGANFLAVEDPPTQWLLQGLQPEGTNALLAAQAKSGKTTMVTNLIKALCDGESFLGSFLNSFDGTVTLIDDELDDRMLRRWLKNIGITMPQNLRIVTLRGRLSTFDITNEHIRAQWVNNLQGTDYLILDCLRPALDACGLDENHEAGIFLNAYAEMLKQANIASSLVVHHMGHSASRSRGDSRIMDWPDILWKLTRKDPEDHTSPRFFEAFGREVDVAKTELEYNDGKLSLAPVGGNYEPATPEEWMISSWLIHADGKNQNTKWWKEQASIDSHAGRYSPGANEAERLVKQLSENGTFGTIKQGRGYVYYPAPSSVKVKEVMEACG